MAANPGWCCLGDELDPNLCTYSVSSSHVWTFEIVGGMEPAGTFLVPLGNHSVQLLGTPSAPGIYTYTIRAHETGNPSVTVEVTDTLKVFGMVTTSLPDGTVAVPYGPVQLQTAGGTEPVTFSLVGSLPAGLTLSADGIISGTPTTEGDSSFTVKFTDCGERHLPAGFVHHNIQHRATRVLPGPAVRDWNCWNTVSMGASCFLDIRRVIGNFLAG